MGLRINSNIAALSSYNNLNKTDKAVSSSLEKLSSGYRINRAADDAAGLVVSEGLKSQIGGLTVAARNAQDGVNVAQTADGALSTVTDILQRMRDLAVQASNSGSQDATAQSAANTEFTQLKSELNRISQTTQFGGQQLLSGSYNGQFQVGAFNTANDRINVNLTASGAFGTGAAAVAAGATSPTGGKVVTAAVTGIDTSSSNKTIVVDGQSVTLSGNYQASGGTNPVGLAGLASDIQAGLTGYTVTVSGTSLTIQKTATGASSTAPVISGDYGNGLTSGGTPTNGQDAGYSFGTAGLATGFGSTGLGLDAVTLVNPAGVPAGSSTGLAAQSAIDFVDNALKNISNARASIGAAQNRFEKTIDNLNTAIQNITASNSAIRDTDMAAEMTKFTKNQVLAQAGTSMLAQANSSTQNILTLLRG